MSGDENITPREWSRALPDFQILVDRYGMAGVARRLGCTRTAVSYWLTGRARPRRSRLRAILNLVDALPPGLRAGGAA